MKILFVCKHNASRSILAEAIAKKILPRHFQIASGGSHPKGQINPRIAQYLEMHGFDASEFHSTSWEERLSFHPDLIITVCDTMHNETCPNWLSAGIRVAWDLEPLPNDDASISEFNKECDNIYASLTRRIEALATIDFQKLDSEKIKQHVLELKSM
ncbi:arsenate reductase [Vibrio cholerae]|uniref:Low molecular weight phosphatase family protein n=1 Tax=Vibrio cholerae TaxID=666 RepID=A0A7Z7YCF9_VIBCL|nr:low molecular weight phosphatase family protein [Vibrio cholerae]MDF4532519.1 low molecular weight phosphatase family protein [Vibrio parahaemolyticus]EGR10198.1 low molecular weight phosphotyrosine phosphatase family protein [Vibrio cholerae HE48]EGR1964762.1 low molecular weight phosphatase family protein [Vibrio cholerae]EGR2439910.1 low molecular weight phosphatase family protein [Vibrio cholerae]EGR2449340.1 low molecular weight phosphatase family protein [Vibrio cholerae]